MDALARDTAHPARPFQWTGLPTAVVGRREVWMDVQGVAIRHLVHAQARPEIRWHSGHWWNRP